MIRPEYNRLVSLLLMKFDNQIDIYMKYLLDNQILFCQNVEPLLDIACSSFKHISQEWKRVIIEMYVCSRAAIRDFVMGANRCVFSLHWRGDRFAPVVVKKDRNGFVIKEITEIIPLDAQQEWFTCVECRERVLYLLNEWVRLN